MKDFLTFRKMLTPLFIQFIFWIVMVSLAFVAIYDIIHHTSWVILFQIIIIAPIVTRIFCEILILFFRMNDNLVKIVERCSSPAATLSHPEHGEGWHGNRIKPPKRPLLAQIWRKIVLKMLTYASMLRFFGQFFVKSEPKLNVLRRFEFNAFAMGGMIRAIYRVNNYLWIKKILLLISTLQKPSKF